MKHSNLDNPLNYFGAFFWLNVSFPAETNAQQQGIIIVIERFYLIYLSWAKALRGISKIPDFRPHSWRR